MGGVVTNSLVHCRFRSRPAGRRGRESWLCSGCRAWQAWPPSCTIAIPFRHRQKLRQGHTFIQQIKSFKTQRVNIYKLILEGPTCTFVSIQMYENNEENNTYPKISEKKRNESRIRKGKKDLKSNVRSNVGLQKFFVLAIARALITSFCSPTRFDSNAWKQRGKEHIF